MNPPTVLLDRSFVHALTIAADPHHDDAVRCYRQLVEEFTAERRLLTMTSDLRRELNGFAAEMLAPVDTLHVAGQERHAAEHVRFDPRTESGDAELALHLVLVRRHHIASVATFDERFAAYDVDMLPG
jgi:predicted nucleic acid-binding protein